MSSRIWVLLLGFVLRSGVALAEADSAVSVQAIRRIELLPEGVQAAPEIIVSPGLSTGLFFDAELVRDAVTLEGRESFSILDAGQTVIRVMPSSKVAPGERFLLTVRFRDGAAPANASFLLKVHPARAEPLVEVYREKRTIETYQQEAREARAVALRYQEENARLIAERAAPGGLTGLISTGAMDAEGVSVRILSKAISQVSGSGVEATKLQAYRSTWRVAVEVWLSVKAGAPPWSAIGATLKSKTGEELKVLRVWQREPITPGVSGLVVVEAESTLASSRATFALKLWEEAGPRTVTLGNVTFP
ncbi:DUF2381 family protein [Corallococcus exiguus]|uniref:DUF2381 family protein n=1 Tax=Corallococcus exiguus TaxID=83462 RepID=UPI00184BECBE|nr:DUF2381 family protein [Corallococcus exiguus]